MSTPNTAAPAVEPEVKHTPTPWRLEDVLGDDIATICAGSPCVSMMDIIAQVGLEPAHPGDITRETALANAEFIVRACNAHDDLTAALRYCREAIRTGKFTATNIAGVDAIIAKAISQEVR